MEGAATSFPECVKRLFWDVDPAVGGAAALASGLPACVVTGESPGTLHLQVDGLPVSILAYRYPLLREPEAVAGVAVPVASAEDLACMKLAAIAGRGAAKDFWDLDALLSHGVAGGSLAAAVDVFCTKYAQHDRAHLVKALAYFGDADAAPLPRGLTASRWSDLKKRFADRVRAL